MDWVQERLPPGLARMVKRTRGQDILLYAAALAFYAVVSVVPLTILVMWIVSLVLGDQRTHQLAEEIRRSAPRNIGADQALERVAQLGTNLGIISLVAALWPATAYGSGLERAFDRLGPRADRRLEGLRGRGLFFVVILPTFIMGCLIGSFLGAAALGSEGAGRIIGYVLALASGFLAAAACLVLIYRLFPPTPLTWSRILRATVVAAAGISVLSVLFILFIQLGANFEQHYATSGLAGLVLLALWLFLSNALVLAGYRVALETDAS
jgi:membrane protein